MTEEGVYPIDLGALPNGEPEEGQGAAPIIVDGRDPAASQPNGEAQERGGHREEEMEEGEGDAPTGPSRQMTPGEGDAHARGEEEA